MSQEKLNLKGYSLEEMKDFCQEIKIESFRAKQIADWIYVKGVSSFAQMSNLSLALRERLTEKARISSLRMLAKQESSQDGTSKYLWQLEDGNTVETVLMPYEKRSQTKSRITVCISSQVGCAMGCVFCATGLQGFVRNLTTGEMLDQVVQINRDLQEEDPKKNVTNVVIMGMGEPLLNYDNTIKAVKLFNSFLNISMRRVALSTCGIVPKIELLAEENLPLVLAVSLHAPNNELRNQLMPINRKYPLEVLLPACASYVAKTGRRISFEYSLMEGINSLENHARQLADLLGNLLCHVNLIPINPVQDSGYTRPGRDTIQRFKKILEDAGITVSIREEKGVEILAACGQLRQKEANKNGINSFSGKVVRESN